MNKQDVIAFFDHRAPQWDEEMVRKEDIIALILDNAQVTAGKHILDVACGTGVLIPDYLNRNVSTITGVDFSSEMIKIAKKKFQKEPVQLLCEDIETVVLPQKYDCIVVYNAFPHFPNPELLIERLVGLLLEGGSLTVAHSMSRERLTQHHSGAASKVSIGLLPLEELVEIFQKYVHVDIAISNKHMYQVVGRKL